MLIYEKSYIGVVKVKAVIQNFLLYGIRLKVLITQEEYLPTWENFVQGAFTLHRLHPRCAGQDSIHDTKRRWSSRVPSPLRAFAR
jgi:hypothetical protein